MKLVSQILVALMATLLVGCVEWHSSGPTAAQGSQIYIPAWSQVHIGMTREQVYALMGKPLQETEQVAKWKGAEAKQGWPLNYPPISYWREYVAYFDSDGRVKDMSDFNKQDR